MDHLELKTSRPDQYQFTVHTFGCKVNTYDTGLLQKNLTKHGFQPAADQKKTIPIHVLNTCAVTSEATQQAVRLIRKIKSKEPLATVVVTGCAAQVDTGAFEKVTAADLIVANSHKGLLPQLLDQYFKGDLRQQVFKSNIFKKEDLEIGGGEELRHTRSFLKIQDGCNSFCSFCIIPYARGKSRSIPVTDLVQKIKELESQNVQEVVLTGVHIGDYLDESNTHHLKIEDLIESILKSTRMPRIRLSSLEPIEISDRLLNLFKEDRLCAHFHMSIQSADSSVLKEMKRHYGEEDVKNSLLKIQKQVPGCFVGMDVIAGFPSETDEQFENTYKVLSETPWTRLHVFPYSERPGTKAATLPQIHQMKRKERAARLRQLSLHRWQAEALQQIGLEKKALIFNKYNPNDQALSKDYWSIQLDLSEVQHDVLKNTQRRVTIQSVSVQGENVALKANLAHV